MDITVTVSVPAGATFKAEVDTIANPSQHYVLPGTSQTFTVTATVGQIRSIRQVPL